MKKRILSALLVLVMCAVMLPPSAFAAGETLSGSYASSTVTVTGTGFAPYMNYMIKLMKSETEPVLAHAQADADGEFSVAINTGTLSAGTYDLAAEAWNGSGIVTGTFTVTKTKIDDGGGGGGGGGGGNAVITPSANGKVTVSPPNPAKGDKVTLTATPDEGYEIDRIIVTDKDGNIIPVTDLGDGKFTYTQPEGAVTITAIFKKIAEPVPLWASFTDITGHWANDYIRFVVERGLFSGTSETTFAPNASMTRAMFATVLSRLEGADTSAYASSRFGDVPGGQWYTGGIEWAAQNGIVSGIGEGLFNPNGEITREQMAVMLYRYLQYKGYDLPMLNSSGTFNDEGQISEWAKEAVDYMYRAGIFTGKPGNLFDPQGIATRAEVATVFARFIEALEG